MSTTMSNSDISVLPGSASFEGLDSEAYHADVQLGLSNVLPYDLVFVQSTAHFLSSHGPATYLSPSISQNDFGPTRINYGYLNHGLAQSATSFPSSHGPATYQPPAPVNQNQPRSKDRPRCFEHGCEGRAFSCRENYRRHLREKNRSGSVVCTICGLFFSRKSNREKHILDGKCKTLTKAFVNATEETAN